MCKIDLHLFLESIIIEWMVSFILQILVQAIRFFDEFPELSLERPSLGSCSRKLKVVKQNVLSQWNRLLYTAKQVVDLFHVNGGCLQIREVWIVENTLVGNS